MLKSITGGGRLLFFYEPVRPSDIRAARRQMAGRNFDPSIMLGTAERCAFGFPRVIVCSPLSPEGVPFPTSFWLTCPRLNRLAGTLESSGGVSGLEDWLARAGAKNEWPLFDLDHRLIRLSLLTKKRLDYLRSSSPKIFDRLRFDGIGGTRYDKKSPVRVKCLHLQTASWLALRRHPGGEWLASRGLGLDCGHGLCAT